MAARFAALVSNKEELLAALISYPQAIPNKVWINHQATNKVASDCVRVEEMAEQWINGAKIDWQKLYTQQTPNQISLPTYPFMKRRCWIPTKEIEPAPIVIQPEIKEAIDCSEWLYTTQWEKNPYEHSGATKDKGKWLIFSDQELGLVLQQELGSKECIYCFSGENYAQIDEQVYYINPTQKGDYEQLLNAVNQTHGMHVQGVIYLCSMINTQKANHVDPSLALFYLLQTIIQFSWQHSLLFTLVTQSAQQVNSSDIPNLWQHHLWSMTRIFGAEQANYQVALLDLDVNQGFHENARLIVNEINHAHVSQNHIAYRANERYTIRFSSESSPENQLQPWKAPVAALITGGLGALGYEVAEYVISQGTRFVLLTGTTELSPQTTEKNTWLKQLEAKGVNVKYVAVDVADKSKMYQVIQDAEKAWQCSIDGVFHLAGITTDNVPIANMEEDLWRRVLEVKVQGALVLHELFMNAKLSSFVLFSSIAAVPHFGMAGLSAYAVANEFLSGLALYRRSQQLPAISINWVAWAEKGMSHQHNHDAFLDAVGMASLAIREGVILLDEILKQNPAEITVCKIQWKKFLQVNATAKQLDFFKHFVSEHAVSTPITTSLSETQIATLVMELLAQVLGLMPDEIDKDTPFQQYGMDSITGISYTEELGKHFPDLVSPMDLYRYPTLQQLAEYIIQRVQPSNEPHAVVAKEINLDELNYEQLNALIESELKELELAYE